MESKKFWSKVRKVARKFPLTLDAVAAYLAVLDERTPLAVKTVIVGALTYFVSPVDAVPDIIVGLGYVDDAAVLMGAIAAAQGSIRAEHWDRARKFLSQ